MQTLIADKAISDIFRIVRSPELFRTCAVLSHRWWVHNTAVDIARLIQGKQIGRMPFALEEYKDV